ncbi:MULTISPECIES: NAD(P)-dependent oxidoreductase [unclassified Rathayibacter]|uniref:NAD(P)-dependent oxidoreductase n=1 Tax=unclassified Rathayibacter TaxID=2609250 RepID=UPI001FB22C9E|nr:MULTISPECIES: NAD(P)-dependent oxidoreductase [unclassified Rathayibacter]MCJ1671661.1 NAD(P)-dependent oxidoreductase [Rathayibacter sp. VKM Ac-2929]MCJ1684167.1 NAD(P)-dependent oxidoreductase [Rathayibacter sp. VKM Ac-2928]
MRLSLLGLGPMGAPMARNLLAAASLTVWNRTASRAAPFAELGAVVAPTPAAAAGDVVLTVLPDLVQVESLLEGEDGLLAGWRAAGIAAPVLVVHGTVSPIAVAALARRLAAEHGVQVVDAPLSGGTVGARDATLSIMVGGADEPVARVLPVFERLGRTVRHLGPSGAGATAKLCNQIVVAGTVAVVSEALLLARSAGLDPATVVELLQGGLARTAVLEQKSRKWLDEDFAEGGSARNQLKDLRFVAESAAAEGVALPTTAAVTALFERMIAEGDGDLDHTGVHRTLAGLARRPEEPHA